jgi:hypothetical protein
MDRDDELLDPMGLDTEGSDKEYVPRFERDLEKMGSLEALSQAKKAEKESYDAVLTAYEEDPSPYGSDEDEYDEPTAPDESYDSYDSLDEYSAENELNPHYQYHTKPVTEENLSSQGTRRAKSFADFAKEAEEEEKRAKAEAEEQSKKNAYHDLDDVKVSADMISDMGYSDKKNTANNIRQQMELDDLAMEMNGEPQIEEMSTIYNATQKRADVLTSKDTLDKEEKQLIKERLEKEIGKRPEGYSKRTSLEMYHNLMNEQKIKKAKKGFFVVVMLIALGIITAVVTYFKLNWNESQLFTYISFGAAAFSLLLLVKVKFFKNLACVYFAINTVLLIGPGFVKFALDTSSKPDTYIETLIFFIAAIAMSAIICIQLCTSASVDAYYTTQLIGGKKKVVDARKSKYRQ